MVGMIVQPSAMQQVAATVSEPTPVPAKPLKLHAPDAAGRCAHEAAMFADAVTYGLLAASSPSLDAADRRQALVRLFAAWPALCRTMSELESAAPRSAAEGSEIAKRLRDMAEAAELRTPQAGSTGPGIQQKQELSSSQSQPFPTPKSAVNPPHCDLKGSA